VPSNYQGLFGPVGFGVETQTVLHPFLREIFIQEAPLVNRLPRLQAEGETFQMITYDVRQRTGITLGAAVSDTTGTTVTLSDNTRLLVGDVILVDSEKLEVTAINSNGTSVTVVRGAESSTAATHTNTTAVTLMYNSRTGAEVNQDSTRSIRTSIEQYVQTFQFPVQISGKANAQTSVRLPQGVPDILTFEQRTKAVEMLRDMEYACYYAGGQKPQNPGDRAKMKGIKTLIDSGNVTTSAASSYTKLSFISDTLNKAFAGGGNPDLLIVSSDFMTGVATWGYPVTMDTSYTPVLGIAFNQIAVPFLGAPVLMLPSYQLKAGTAIALTSSDVKLRYLRQETWVPRGRRGDAYEGDWIADIAVEIGHPKWHAWREGISSFA
jgi:hypothetical protein